MPGPVPGTRKRAMSATTGSIFKSGFCLFFTCSAGATLPQINAHKQILEALQGAK